MSPVELLPAELSLWNQTAVDYPRDSTIATLFSEQAAQTPDSIALIDAAGSLTYCELNERSNRLARRLQRLGVKSEALVGVAMERSSELVVSLLAILKAGAAYVPLDSDHPRARLSLVIDDSGLSTILTTRQIRSRLPVADDRVLVLDSDAAAVALESAHPVPSTATPAGLAYVIYTSGSTGKPKGVMVENRNVVNFFTGMDRAIGRQPGVWLAVTSISFDISVLELLWTLTRGFTVVIHSTEGPQSIADQITRHRVTHLQMTPSLARMLAMDPRSLTALGSLKQLLLGGEVLPGSLAVTLRRVFSGDFFNMYGPTETTIWSTTHRLVEPGPSIPIGRPIANTQVYLLDEKLNPIPVGEVGELFIGGAGVARGYWNRPALTAERFLDDPFLPGSRIYRTGDLARYLPSGEIQYLGRADFQIKIRGFRIEPGEIETILEQQPGVKQAAVVAREDKTREDQMGDGNMQDKRLVAYLVTVGGHGLNPNDLRHALAARLPEYMVPSAFVFRDELPLTGNWKLDRSALLRLPPPDPSPAAVPTPPPVTDLESTIAHAWQRALGLGSVGIDDNFFDLGAHSLTVAEVQAGLREALAREISLIDLFEFPTVRTLARHLAGAAVPDSLSERARRRFAARKR